MKPRGLRSRLVRRTLARAEERTRSRPRLDARTRRSFSVSLSRSHAWDSSAHARAHSFHFIRPRRRRSTNGYARTSLARGDDADEDADDAFVRVSSLVVSRRDARALGEDEDERETDDDAAGRRRRGRFSIRPERIADVRG